MTAGATVDRTITGFGVGEKVTFIVTRPPPGFGSDGVSFSLTDGLVSLYSSPDGNAVSETTTFTFVASSVLKLTAALDSFGVPASVTATCTAVVAALPAPTGPTDSQKLRSVQTEGTRIVAQTAGGAIANAVDGAISDSLDGVTTVGTGGGGNGAPAGLGGPIPGRLGAQPTQDQSPEPTSGAFSIRQRDWNAWGNLRVGNAARRPNAGGFEGHQVNATFGLGHRVASGLVVGIFGGYEQFGYDIRSLTGKLTGDGLTGGAYVGWRMMPGLRFDLTGARTGLDYDARAATASGNFEGKRWLASSGLTGTTVISGLVLEPSARVFAIREHQDAWTDSLGTRQADNSFALGRASAGLRISQPWQAGRGLTLVPYAGLYGDYYFSRGEAVTPGTEVLAIADGWSARAIGGMTLDLGGTTVSLGGEWGGLGADHTQRALTVRGALPF